MLLLLFVGFDSLLRVVEQTRSAYAVLGGMDKTANVNPLLEDCWLDYNKKIYSMYVEYLLVEF